MKISFEIIPTTSKGTRTTEPNNSEQKLTIVNPGIKPNMAAVKTTQSFRINYMNIITNYQALKDQTALYTHTHIYAYLCLFISKLIVHMHMHIHSGMVYHTCTPQYKVCRTTSILGILHGTILNHIPIL